MVLPIVTQAPVVAKHSEVFRGYFENQNEFRHFENYLTGLIVLKNKSLANISRSIIESADKTNISRFFSEAPWEEHYINDRRISYMLEQTTNQRRKSEESCLILDDTLCEHVGSLFEYVARHYDHSENRHPLAHNLVTSFYVSGAVRFPVDLRTYRRYEEVTQWEKFVKKHFPDKEIPKGSKQRNKFKKEVEGELLKDKEFKKLHDDFQTKIELAQQIIEKAIERKLPFKVVLMDSWYLTDEIVELLKEQHKDWVSLLKKNRNLEVNSFTLYDELGNKVKLTGPHISVEELVAKVPSNAYKKETINGKDYWCFTLVVGIPGLKKVRIVISFDNKELTGTHAVLVSNRRDWAAHEIISLYLQRWPIETFYQDGKGHLGLDDYRMRTIEAIKKHWCLVFVAYSILHLECLPSSLVESKGSKAKEPLFPIKTIGQVCRQQTEAVIESLILFAHNLLQKGKSAAFVFSKLFAKQHKAEMFT